MLAAYRIFKTKREISWFDGEGAFRYGGRWNSPANRVLYASQNLSLAALEMLVHLNSDSLLLAYSFAELQFDAKLVADVNEFAELPKDWFRSPPPKTVQRIGDKWISSRESPILKVPSAVVTGESNFLFNIEHRDFAKVKLGEPKSFAFDRRLR